MAEIKIGNVVGPPGSVGKSIEYEWSGTELGVRIEGSPTFEYVDLKGSPGVTEVTKADVGLGNVDNTSDLNKPISSATAAGLSLKADLTYVNDRLGEIDNVLDAINGEVI